MSTVILVEVDVSSPGGDASTLRFSDRSIWPFPPVDPDRPNLVWEDRLIETPTVRRALFEDLANLTPALGFGVMLLANADRGLDGYQGHAWGEVRVWRWPVGQPFSAGQLVIRGLVGPPAFDASSERPGRVNVGLYDYSAELDRPIAEAVYGGTNGSGGMLWDGVAGGVKGRSKPIGYGRLDGAHVPAPQVNGARLGYQLHDGAIEGSEQIFDRGAPAGFTAAGDRIGPAFDAFTPALAAYATDHGRGLLQINGSPVGRLSFGLRGDATGGYVETPGPIVARLLARCGVPAARISAEVPGLPATAVAGCWTGDAGSGRNLVAWVARSASAAALPRPDGVWTLVPFGPPAEAASHAIDFDEVLTIEADQTAPGPVGEVRIGWGRQWTQFTSAELAPALRGTEAEERLAAEYRYAVAVQAAAKTRFPRTWRTLQITTALRLEADAVALANRLRDLFGLRPDGRPRRMWRVAVELTGARQAVALGETVRLTYPLYGIDDRFVLIAEEPMRPRRDLTTWTLWG